MQKLEKNLLLVAAQLPDGVIESRHWDSELGWEVGLTALVKAGYFKPLMTNYHACDAGDYLISAYQLSTEGRTAAGALQGEGRTDEQRAL